MKSIHNLSSRVLMIILDGYGLAPKLGNPDLKNAIENSHKPFIDHLFSNYPMTTLEPGGELVGLPKGVAGNSEVGHMNLGAGRPVRQDLVRINEAIHNDTLKDMDELKSLIQYAKAHGNKIHLMGLLSDGGVHSHISHLQALVKIFHQTGIQSYLHAFTDGRDTAKNTSPKYITEALNFKGLTLASLQGRSIGMDRDRRWNKIQDAYKTFIGEGKILLGKNPLEYVEEEYALGRYDEFINPVLFHEDFKIHTGEAVFFFNFRPDRAIQLSLALNDPKFKEFDVPVKPGYFLCMTPYIPDEVTLPILFDKEKISGTLSEYLSSLKIPQYKIAETEKYAHVTFFFNGGEKKPFPLEKHTLIPSPRHVATYDELPEMSAPEITQTLIKAIEEDEAVFYLVNYANSDMVGHTGNYLSAVKAIECLNNQLERLFEVCMKKNLAMIITADHGNSEQMIYPDGGVHTSHTNSPVPFCLIHPNLKNCNSHFKTQRSDLALKDVAPTILKILGVAPAPEFTGEAIFP